MPYTRRQVLAGAAIGALGTTGVYELVDRLASAGRPRTAPGPRPEEQHVLRGLAIVSDNGVEVVVPPLHHQIVTARVRTADLHRGRCELESALASLEARYANSPAGLGITVAWGLPYFDRFVARQAAKHLPTDLRASTTTARVAALTDAIRFPSDPEDVILERNDAAVLLRSDHQEHVAQAARVLFHDLDVFEPTSIRQGFVGSDGFSGPQSLAKRMALAAQVPGADLVPDRAELFLGFTSTQRAALGPERIANLETLGYTDAAGGYFHQGTHMHVSHIDEDLEAWYLNFSFDERVETMFRPGQAVPPGTLTVQQEADLHDDPRAIARQFAASGRIGHSSVIQTASRLQQAIRGHDGTVYPKGTAIPQRADFNTLDNPFFWSAHPARDGFAPGARAGLHFVVFNPSSDDFNRGRLAMDGRLPTGTRLPLPPGARGQGFNAVLRTTHRQNFLVPPRRHRAFPLAELRA